MQDRPTGQTSICKEPAGSFRLFLGTGSTGSKLGGGNGVQEGAHVGSARRAERLLELPLRLHPSFHPRPKTGFSSLGHPQLLAPAVTAILLDSDQTITLQRQDVPAEGGAVHHHLYRVLKASEGSEAINLARDEQPDLILMDIKLPGISGFDVTRLLKYDNQTKAIPIIAVTAFATPGDETRL